ncbi:MAG: hypothetical protein AAGA55_05540 [Planctomycetota bacterium]
MKSDLAWLGRLNVTVALLIAALAWSGCGPGRTISMPNGYICYVDKDFIQITDPATYRNGVSDVAELDVRGDIVFGRRADIHSGDHIGYFMLDTRAKSVELFDTQPGFEAALAAAGLDGSNIRGPGLLFHAGKWFRWAVLLVCPLVILPVIICMRRSTRRGIVHTGDSSVQSDHAPDP